MTNLTLSALRNMWESVSNQQANVELSYQRAIERLNRVALDGLDVLPTAYPTQQRLELPLWFEAHKEEYWDFTSDTDYQCSFLVGDNIYTAHVLGRTLPFNQLERNRLRGRAIQRALKGYDDTSNPGETGGA